MVLEKNLESGLDCKESNQSILKEINPGISLEGMMLKLKLQYFGHLMRRVDPSEKTLMLGGIGKRRRGRQRMRWLDGITDTMDVSLSELLRGTAREGLSLGSCSALCRALGTSLSSLSRPPEEFTTLKAPGRLGLATFHRR